MSRYGGSAKRELRVDAECLNPAEVNIGGDRWKKNLEILSKPVDWWVRIPGGERHRVMIKSVDRNTAYPTNGKVLSVSVSCEVVDADG